LGVSGMLWHEIIPSKPYSVQSPDTAEILISKELCK
jgi:hypothetical protein